MGDKDSPSPQPQSTSPSIPSAVAPATAPVPVVSSTPLIDQYVSTDKLNLRDQPAGKVISSLKRGDRVQVYEKKNEWVRVSADGQPAKWLSSKNLCSGTGCYAISVPRSPIQPAVRTNSNVTPSYGSSCPCSSGSVCIGPRGGRYCITSRGNKRYGI